jgi:hypothetical protein
MVRRPLRGALCWALLILVLCLLPGQHVPSYWWAELLDVDKWVHAGVFAVLVGLLAQGLGERRGGYTQARLSALALGIGYGALTEWLQSTPLLGRTMDGMDLSADAIGCVLGLLFWPKLPWHTLRQWPLLRYFLR